MKHGQKDIKDCKLFTPAYRERLHFYEYLLQWLSG